MNTKTVSRINRHYLQGLLLLMLAAAMPAAHATGIVDTIVNSAEIASGGWVNTALGYAQNLFFGLAAIEFVWAGTQLLLQKSELSEAVVGLLMKIVTIGFFGMMLTMAPTWMPIVMESFKIAGQNIAGAPNLSPSSVIDQGIGVAALMIERGMGMNGGFMQAAFGDGLGKWFLSAIIIGLSGIMVVLAYVVVAVQLAITLIESFIVIGGGILMLGFTGSRWTMSFGERFFGYAVSIGVKLLTLYLIVGLGSTMTTAIMDHISTIAAANGGHLGFTDFLGVGGASVAYGAIGYLVPGLAGTMLNGSPSLSMSNMSAAGKGMASAPVGATLSAGAAGARGMALGAAGAAGIASLFAGGGKGGSISGSPSGGGLGVGTISGNPGNGAGGGSGLGSKPGGGSGGGAGGPAGNASAAPSAGQGADGKTQDGKGESKESAQNKPETSSGTSAGTSSGTSAGQTGAAGGGEAPGFQAGQGSQAPRSMDPERRDFERASGGGYNQQQAPSRLSRFAQSLNGAAREMQYASRQHSGGLPHDGSTGGAPNIRLNI